MGGAGWAEGPALAEQGRGRRFPWTLVSGAVIAVALLVVWIEGERPWLFPCEAEYGETFDAGQYGKKYRSYGLCYGLAEDMSMSAAPGRPKPQL